MIVADRIARQLMSWRAHRGFTWEVCYCRSPCCNTPITKDTRMIDNCTAAGKLRRLSLLLFGRLATASILVYNYFILTIESLVLVSMCTKLVITDKLQLNILSFYHMFSILFMIVLVLLFILSSSRYVISPIAIWNDTLPRYYLGRFRYGVCPKKS